MAGAGVPLNATRPFAATPEEVSDPPCELSVPLSSESRLTEAVVPLVKVIRPIAASGWPAVEPRPCSYSTETPLSDALENDGVDCARIWPDSRPEALSVSAYMKRACVGETIKR